MMPGVPGAAGGQATGPAGPGRRGGSRHIIMIIMIKKQYG